MLLCFIYYWSARLCNAAVSVCLHGQLYCSFLIRASLFVLLCISALHMLSEMWWHGGMAGEEPRRLVGVAIPEGAVEEVLRRLQGSSQTAAISLDSGSEDDLQVSPPAPM